MDEQSALAMDEKQIQCEKQPYGDEVHPSLILQES